MRKMNIHYGDWENTTLNANHAESLRTRHDDQTSRGVRWDNDAFDDGAFSAVDREGDIAINALFADAGYALQAADALVQRARRMRNLPNYESARRLYQVAMDPVAHDM